MTASYCQRDHPLRRPTLAHDALGHAVCLVCVREGGLLRARLARQQLVVMTHQSRCARCHAPGGCQTGERLNTGLQRRQSALAAWLALASRSTLALR
jgi:hypothetical protein